MAPLSIETRKLYFQLRQDVVTLHFRASIMLELYRSGTDNIQVMNNAAQIFFDRVLKEDMQEAMALGIGRLLDPPTQGKYVNASLARLIEEVSPIEPNLAATLKTHLDNLIARLPNVDNYRDKWAAHRDYDVMLTLHTPSQAGNRPRYSPSDIKFALIELDLFMNAFEAAFEDKQIVNPDPQRGAELLRNLIGKPTQYSAFDAANEVKNMLETLREAKGH